MRLGRRRREEMDYYAALVLEIELLEEQERCLQERIDMAYDGFVVCQKYRDKYYHYRKYKVGGKWKRTRLTEEDDDLLFDLVQKRENRKKLRRVCKKLTAARAYVKVFENYREREMRDSPGMLELLDQLYEPDRLDFREWGGAPYRGHTDFHPEQLLFRTGKGDERVRSKSEELIARALRAHGIEYHYEEETKVGYWKVYPDFTIRHPRTGELIIWEHHGMMDDRKYAAKTGDKLRNYLVNGYSQTTNLITTFEDRRHPLSIDEVNRIIEEKLLAV